MLALIIISSSQAKVRHFIAPERKPNLSYLEGHWMSKVTQQGESHGTPGSSDRGRGHTHLTAGDSMQQGVSRKIYGGGRYL